MDFCGSPLNCLDYKGCFSSGGSSFDTEPPHQGTFYPLHVAHCFSPFTSSFPLLLRTSSASLRTELMMPPIKEIRPFTDYLPDFWPLGAPCRTMTRLYSFVLKLFRSSWLQNLVLKFRNVVLKLLLLFQVSLEANLSVPNHVAAQQRCFPS